MDDFKAQLDSLNDLAEKIYAYAESGDMSLTRRRLLILQKLSFVDSNTNAVSKLLLSNPRFVDGASMIMRSIYDLSINVDWVLRDRKNTRLWRWLRDDKKTLHNRIEKIVELKTSNPRLNSKSDPLSVWQNAYSKVDSELDYMSAKASVSVQTKEESLFAKVRSFNASAQLIYHTVFWLFSTKSHASATGLQDMVQLNPLRIRRRNDIPNAKDDEEARMLMRTTLLWYSANILQAARYLKTPFIDAARQAHLQQLSRKR